MLPRPPDITFLLVMTPFPGYQQKDREDQEFMSTEETKPKGPNWELIDKTLVSISHSPDNFNMGFWAAAEDVEEQQLASIPLCGTEMCFAGWVVFTAGHQIDWGRECCTDGREILEVAMDLLGISEFDALRLFASNGQANEMDVPFVFDVEDLRGRITRVLGPQG